MLKDNNEPILDEYNVNMIHRNILLGIFSIILWFFIASPIILKMFPNSQLNFDYLIIFNIFIAVPELIILVKKYKEVTVNRRLNVKIFNQIKIIFAIILLINYAFIVVYTPIGQAETFIYYFIIFECMFLDFVISVFVGIGLELILMTKLILQFINSQNDVSTVQELIGKFVVHNMNMMLIFFSVYSTAKILLTVKEKEQKYKEEYFRKIENNHFEMRIFRHNLKNEMMALKYYIDNNDFDKADNIVNGIIKESDILKKDIYTENAIINTILNSKVNASDKYGVKWIINVNIPDDLRIDIVDISIILGNIFDNAIEACSLIKKGERFINVNMYCQNRNLYINVKNSKNNNSVKEITWKSDKENHGIGLKSVKNLLNKYNGFMKNEDKGDYYEAEIMLWNV